MKTPGLSLKHPPSSGIVLALGAALALWCGRTQAQTPYTGTPSPIPGQIEAEDFDNGGEGVAYHDNDASNNGGQYRTTGVDIETCNEGGYDVGWTGDGEWLKYTVAVTPGKYDITFRVASGGGGAGYIDLKMFGTNLCSSPAIYNTGGWGNWISATVPWVQLPGGTNILTLYERDANYNMNWISFTANPYTGPPTAPSGLTATALTPYGIQLDWTLTAYDASLIHIERKDGVSGTYAEVGTAAGTDTTYTDGAGLFPGHTYYYRLRAENTFQGQAFSAYSNEAHATQVAHVPSQPFSQAYEVSGTTNATQETEAGTARSVLGLMQAAWFDIGGEAIAYHDTTPGDAGNWRVTDVDTGGVGDPLPGGGRSIGNQVAGEWVSYTVNVSTAGNYDFNYRYTSQGTVGSIMVSEDGNVLFTLNIPDTGSWAQWRTVSTNGIPLPAGVHTLRIDCLPGWGNDAFNWFLWRPSPGASPPLAPTGLTATPLTARSIGLTWTNHANDASEIDVQHSTNGTDWVTVAALTVLGAGTGATNYTDVNLNPGTKYYYRVSAHNRTYDSYSSVVSASTLPPLPGGLMTASGVLSTGAGLLPRATYDLTAEGTLDWAYWSEGVRKTNVVHQISASQAARGINHQNDSFDAYSWSDGDPTESGILNHGQYINGDYFWFTVPSGPVAKTLKVYVGCFTGDNPAVGGSGVMDLQMAGGSAPNFTANQLTSATPGPWAWQQGAYTVHYRSDTNDTLTVTWRYAGGWFISMNAATVTESDPLVVTGNGTEILDESVTPNLADNTQFKAVAGSGGVQHFFTIYNFGTNALNLTGTPRVAITGANAADFTVTTAPSNNVPVAGTTTVGITFHPLSLGDKSATVTIANSAHPANAFNFDIMGTGFAPATLKIARDVGGSLRISWPLAAAGYNLQQSAAIPGGWGAFGGTVHTDGPVGAENYVLITPGGTMFYRLSLL